MANSIQMMPASAAGSAGDDHEWIGPGLEIDDDEQIDQHDGAEQTEQQSGEVRYSLYPLVPSITTCGRRADDPCCVRIHDLLDVGGDSTEIAALHGAGDLDDGLDVVFRIHCGGGIDARAMSATAPSVCNAAPGAVIGKFFNEFSESNWYCGVCVTME